MRYHVTGIDHAKGSHMTLDVEAPSKAAAEKRAQAAGMDVQHIQPAVDAARQDRLSHRGEDDSGGMGWMIRLIFALVVIALIVVFAFPRIRALLHR